MPNASAGIHCFACLPKKDTELSERRQGCVARGYHVPFGTKVVHNHFGVPVSQHPFYECADCTTLVIDVYPEGSFDHSKSTTTTPWSEVKKSKEATA